MVVFVARDDVASRVSFSLALDDIRTVKLSLSSISNPPDKARDVPVFKVFVVAVECAMLESFVAVVAAAVVLVEETFPSLEPLVEFGVSFFFASSLLLVTSAVKPVNKLISLIIFTYVITDFAAVRVFFWFTRPISLILCVMFE